MANTALDIKCRIGELPTVAGVVIGAFTADYGDFEKYSKNTYNPAFTAKAEKLLGDATKNMVFIRVKQLATVLQDNWDGPFKGLIVQKDMDDLLKAGQLYDDNKNLVAENRKRKKVEGTDVLTELKPKGIDLPTDIRTLGEGHLEAGSQLLEGPLEASDIPEFGKRDTNIRMLVTKEDGTLIGNGVTVEDLDATMKKKKKTYNRQRDNNRGTYPRQSEVPFQLSRFSDRGNHLGIPEGEDGEGDGGFEGGIAIDGAGNIAPFRTQPDYIAL